MRFGRCINIVHVDRINTLNQKAQEVGDLRTGD